MEKYEILRSDCVSRIKSCQTQVEAGLSSRVGTITKILVATADSEVYSAEALVGEAVLMGRVVSRLVYLNEEGMTETLEYLSDYTVRVEGEFLPETKLIPSSDVVHTEIRRVTDRDVQLVSTVNVDVYGVLGDEVNALVESDELICDKINIPVTKLTETVDSTFDVAEEYESGEAIKEVLLVDTSLLIKGVNVTDGMITICGEATAILTYSTQSDTVTRSILIPFSEEVRVSGAKTGDTARAYGYVKDFRITLAGTETDTVAKITLTLHVKAPLYSIIYTDAVSDCYSTDRRTEPTRNVCRIRNVSEYSYSESITGSAEIEDGNGISAILTALTPRNVIANAIAYDDKAVIEGLVSTSVLYRDTEEGISSVRVELPYSYTFDAPGLVSGSELIVKTAVINPSATRLSSSRVEVSAVVKFFVEAIYTYERSVVSEVTFGEPYGDLSAISIYTAGATDTLFSVAKGLSTRMETVTDQNPDLSLPLSGGERIVLYRELKV